MPRLHPLGQTQYHIYISQPSCDGKTLVFLRCSVIHMLPLHLCLDDWPLALEMAVLRYRDEETFRVMIMGIFGVKYAEDNLVFGIDHLRKWWSYPLQRSQDILNSPYFRPMLETSLRIRILNVFLDLSLNLSHSELHCSRNRNDSDTSIWTSSVIRLLILSN